MRSSKFFQVSTVPFRIVSALLLMVSLPLSAAPSFQIPQMNQLQGQVRDLQQSSVYVYGDATLDVLIPVRVIGAIEKAGIHYVPKGTDLLTLLTLAGGTSREAELDSIRIRRQGETPKVLTANLDDLVTRVDDAPIQLQSNDVVMIPQSKPSISDDTLRIVSLVASLAAIVSTGFLIASRR